MKCWEFDEKKEIKERIRREKANMISEMIKAPQHCDIDASLDREFLGRAKPRKHYIKAARDMHNVGMA